MVRGRLVGRAGLLWCGVLFLVFSGTLTLLQLAVGADPEQKRAAIASHDDLVGITRGDHGDAVRALDVLEGVAHPILENLALGLFETPLREGGGVAQPFDPGEPYKYVCEGTPWVWTWYVPHDIQGVINLLGSRQKFVKKLDTFFDEGFYAHDNEPSHQITYLYNYAGAPWKTQERVRDAMREVRVALLEAERRVMVQGCFAHTTRDQDAPEVAAAIREILRLNQEVAHLAGSWKEQIGADIQAQNLGRTAAAVYRSHAR